MGLFGLFEKKEEILAVDIGSVGIKIVQLDLSTETPKLVHLGFIPLSGDIFSNNAISRADVVAGELITLLENSGVSTRLVATSVPGPSVFSKRIKMPKLDIEELGPSIEMEAANFIPQNVESVKLDYHVIGESSKSRLDVLVVAVKTEIIDSLLDTLTSAGLETLVVDVDYFALQNAFEQSYPEEVKINTVALVNIGARYTTVNICRKGASLFTGDVTVGGKSITEGIAEELGLSGKEAEEKKRAGSNGKGDPKLLTAIANQVENISAELNRQLSFFWNASGAEEGIDLIMLSGGGATLPGLAEAVGKKTGISTEIFNPFKGIDCSGYEDAGQLKELSPLMGIAVGLAVRQPGDKIFPEGV